MISSELRLDSIPRRPTDQRRVLAGMPHPFVIDLSDINRVRQDLVNVASREGEITRRAPALNSIRLCSQIQTSEFALHGADVFEFKEQVKDGANGFGLELIHHETALFTLITEWHPTSHPHALLLGGCDLDARSSRS